MVQFVATGLTVGAIYALVALGFSIIYNASHVINFAQGEFVMIGGMARGVVGRRRAAAAGSRCCWRWRWRAVVGLVAREARRRAGAHGRADVVTLIIITIGVALFLRGLAQVLWDKRVHVLPAFSGDRRRSRCSARRVLPQSLWVLGGTALAVVALGWFFSRTLFGKAMRATVAQPAGRAS